MRRAAAGVVGNSLIPAPSARASSTCSTVVSSCVDDAATKLIWLALRNITADWSRAAKEWRAAMNQFAIAYGDRFTRAAA
jgi:transposase-like protein